MPPGEQEEVSEPVRARRVLLASVLSIVARGAAWQADTAQFPDHHQIGGGHDREEPDLQPGGLVPLGVVVPDHKADPLGQQGHADARQDHTAGTEHIPDPGRRQRL